jgi:hypothetical protein
MLGKTLQALGVGTGQRRKFGVLPRLPARVVDARLSPSFGEALNRKEGVAVNGFSA